MSAEGGDRVELAVIGAGPCGLAVGIAAREMGIECRLFDRGAITQAMLEHPTYTTYFSGPEKLEIGGVPFTTAGDKPTRREAVRYYRRVAAHHRLDVRQYQEVTGATREPPGFRLTVRSRGGAERSVRCAQLVVATGYYDNPRRLEIPGGDLAKVHYYFREPFPFWDQDVIVVGGGNSAADAALLCWREGARVTLVHLFDALDRGVKPWVRPDIENRIEEGSIPALWRHRLVEVREREAVVESLETGDRRVLPNDWVLAMTGYVPDPRLLRSLGVEIEAGTGIPTHDPETMMTNVEGVFLAGVLAAGNDANRIFIENGKLHGPRIARAVAGGFGPRP